MCSKGLFLLTSSLLLTSCALSNSSSAFSASSSSEAKTSSSSVSGNPSSSTVSSSSASSNTSVPLSSDAANPVSADFLSFFEAGNHPRIHIEASGEVWNFLSKYQDRSTNKYADAYLPALVSVELNGNDYIFEEAGIRVKGNTSRTQFYSRGSFVDKTHLKISFKATFDDAMYDDPLLSPFKHDWSNDASGRKARKDRSLFGLEKLDLKYVPRNGDDVFMREVYAYRSFASNGIYAPYATLGDVTLSDNNNQQEGDYEFIEPIDKEFLKRRMNKEEAKGDLYKCVYNGMGKANFARDNAVDRSTGAHIKGGKIGVEDNYRGYAPVYQLKTNDDLLQESDFSKMASLLYGLWKCSYGQGDEALLNRLIDVEQFSLFSAISFELGNFDDQRYDYNNFYTYFRPSDGKAIFLPYDYDWCLGEDYGTNLAYKDPLDDWTYDGDTNSNLYQAALLGRSGMAYDIKPYQQRYLEDIAKTKDKVLNPEAFHELASAFRRGNDAEEQEVLSYMQNKRNHCS